ncbi:MAG: hypothetical protein RLN76_07250 [Phycisphaeraceae bacterium]
MSSMLQSVEAAYSDRGEVGVRITLDDDLRGVGHGLSLGGDQDVIHTRLVIRARMLTGGRVTVLAAADSNGVVWWLELDGQAKHLKLVLGNGETLTWLIDQGPSWAAVEVKSDAVLERVTLWVNGVKQGDVALPGLLALKNLDLGSLWRDEQAAGWIDVDEWVIATAYIGPLVVPATSEGVGDPARWLVLYRVSDADSVAWAEEYAIRRKVPYANLIGLDVPADESVDVAGYASVLNQLKDYLDLNGLRDQVAGVLVGYGVPGYVELTPDVERLPLGSMLANDAGDLTPVTNPVYGAEGEGLDASSLSGLRLSARVDGASIAEATAILDRADGVMAGSLIADQLASIWVDTVGPAAAALTEVSARHEAFVASDTARSTRLPVRVGDGQSSGVQSRLQHDAIVWNGLGGALPSGYFGDPAGPRALLVQAGVSAYPLVSLREDVLGSAWAIESLSAGYAAIGGASMTSTIGDIPDLATVIDRLTRGWTLAEAWYAGQARLQTEFCLAGDPLMCVPMDQSGWDVVSASGGALSGQRVIAVRSEITTFDDEALTEGAIEDKRWLVLARDGQGNLADGVRGINIAHDGAGWVDAGVSWVWPTEEGWPLEISETSVRGVVIWPCGLTVAGVLGVTVEIEADGSITERKLRVERTADRVAFEEELMPIGSRLRLRIRMASGIERWTPWSESMTSGEVVPGVQVREGDQHVAI